MQDQFEGVRFTPSDFNTAAPLANAIAGSANDFFSGQKAAIDVQSARLQQDAQAKKTAAEYGRFAGVKVSGTPAQSAQESTGPDQSSQAAAELSQAAQSPTGGAPLPPPTPGEAQGTTAGLGLPPTAQAPGQGSKDMRQMTGTVGNLKAAGLLPQAPSSMEPATPAAPGEPGLPASLDQSTTSAIAASFARDPQAAKDAYLAAGFTPGEIIKMESGKINDDPVLVAKMQAHGDIEAHYGTETEEGKEALSRIHWAAYQARTEAVAKAQQDKLKASMAGKTADQQLKALNIMETIKRDALNNNSMYNIMNPSAKISDEQAVNTAVGTLTPLWAHAMSAAGIKYDDPAAQEMKSQILQTVTQNINNMQDPEASSTWMQRMFKINDAMDQAAKGGQKKATTVPMPGERTLKAPTLKDPSPDQIAKAKAAIVAGHETPESIIAAAAKHGYRIKSTDLK